MFNSEHVKTLLIQSFFFEKIKSSLCNFALLNVHSISM